MNSVLVPRDLLSPAPCDHPSIDDNHHNEFGGVTVLAKFTSDASNNQIRSAVEYFNNYLLFIDNSHTLQ